MWILYLIGGSLVFILALAVAAGYFAVKVICGVTARRLYATNPAEAVARFGAASYVAWIAAQPFSVRWLC